jgi:predicted DNA-binding transcriptional regulator YafY
VVDERALDVPEAELDENYSTAYGIFGGKADKVAVLRCTQERARWVADEKWHPQQEGRWLPEGAYELSIPYRESRELVMDVMRQGAGAEALAPVELRRELGDQLRLAASRYATVP